MNLRRIFDPLNTSANMVESARCLRENDLGGYAKQNGIMLAKNLALTPVAFATTFGMYIIVEKIQQHRNKFH